MIIGIGHDIVEPDRILKASSNSTFLEKTFTLAEIKMILGEDYFNAQLNSRFAQRFAANFTVKEAVVKALGTGFSNGIMPIHIEVLRDDKGIPYVNLYGPAKEYASKLKVGKIHVTISHLKGLASSFVVMED